MISRLDKRQRDELNRVVTDLRRVLADDIANLLEGRYGIHPDGTVEPLAALRLDDGAKETRDELLAILSYFAAEGDSEGAGRDRLLRETVFTHVNRLISIRIGEALGLLPQSLAEGRASQGFRDLVADVAPLLAADDTGGYWIYLMMCGDELASDAPTLFDPRNPLLALAPSPSALDRLVEILRSAPTSVWTAADAVGWAYQFFNAPEERREMREGGAPSTSRELAVRNQFFTPDYVVSYLVHNSLGRRLLEADPGSPLLHDLDWLVDPPSTATSGAPIELAEVRVLDPACGSGHFLLGVYEVLERAWQHQGVPPEHAASRVVSALWGIDIDPRAVQVAAAAVMFRARRSCGRMAPLPRPNAVCARALPPIPRDDLAALSDDHRHVLAELDAELRLAPLLGSLLKVENLLAAEHAAGTVPSRYRGMHSMPLADESMDEVALVRRDVLDLVQRAADQVASTPAERLTAAEADDALRFVEALTQRYDAVLMNPPFGEPIPSTRSYIKAAYPWIPSKDHNLFAAFVGRGIELCNEHGYVGAITSRAGMFLTTFQAWRTSVLLGHRLTTLADLGFGVMEQALVEAAAYVVGAGAPDRSKPIPFIRMLREPAPTRDLALKEVIEHQRSGVRDERLFATSVDAFDALPGSPVAYWMTPAIGRLFTELPALEGHGAEVRQGLATGDDFRFVRAFWEVDTRKIARSREETFHGKRWVPFAKGGEYSPFWADIHLVVDYEKDGECIRQFDGSVVRSAQYYFRPGITWPRRTASGFSPRVLPDGCAFADKGPAMIPLTQAVVVLGWVASRTAGALLSVQLGAADETSSGTASKSYEVGSVKKLPWPVGIEHLSSLPSRVMTFAEEVREADLVDETTRSFRGLHIAESSSISELSEMLLRRSEDRSLELIEQSHSIEADLFALVGHGVEAFVDEEMGTHPADLPRTDIADFGLADEYLRSIEALIAEGVGRRGGLRSLTQKTFVADRRLEVLAHTYEVHPAVIVEQRRQHGLRPPGLERNLANDVLSYLLGCAFGRWDVRIGRDPSLAPPLPSLFDRVPLCPPALLVDTDGMPARQAPKGYPLTLPSHRLLFDEAGHNYDVVDAINDAAKALVDSPSELLNELEELLGRSLREHLRRQFFRDHLGRYSKSRRKAPIYWSLYVPSKQWGVWVYAPMLTRETLFAIQGAADQRLGSAVGQIRRLEVEQLAAGGRTTRDLATLLERERKLAEELRRFNVEARRVAELGWEPDADDGMILTAAPLVDLFPDWATDLAAVRKELKKGMFDRWATVARFKAAL